jgi:hypothetical protein
MKFFKQLFGRACSHRFSWPRVDATGHHYQTCLACGATYEYDWKMMRRTGRMLTTVGQTNIAADPAPIAYWQ